MVRDRRDRNVSLSLFICEIYTVPLNAYCTLNDIAVNVSLCLLSALMVQPFVVATVWPVQRFLVATCEPIVHVLFDCIVYDSFMAFNHFSFVLTIERFKAVPLLLPEL